MVRGDNSTEAERLVPSEMVHSRQRACMSCSLIKSTAQFVSYGCENCPFMGYQSDRERVSACTTPAFVGCYITIKPKESWVAKWQRTGTTLPSAMAAVYRLPIRRTAALSPAQCLCVPLIHRLTCSKLFLSSLYPLPTVPSNPRGWDHLGRHSIPAVLVPGAYAISIDGKMPDDIYEQLVENSLRTHTILATAIKPDQDE
jgi:transcription elongation factor SPT4